MKNYPFVMCAEDVKAALDRGCELPDCPHGDQHDKLVLGQQCCPGAGMMVTVYAADKTPFDRPMLRVQCHQCGKDVVGYVIGKDSE